MLHRLRVAALDALLRLREPIPVYRDGPALFVLVMPFYAIAVPVPRRRA